MTDKPRDRISLNPDPATWQRCSGCGKPNRVLSKIGDQWLCYPCQWGETERKETHVKEILVWGDIEPEFAKLGIQSKHVYQGSSEALIPSVYELTDEDFDRLRAIPEEEWNQAVAWRYAEGSHLGPTADHRVIVNGRYMQGWHGHDHRPGRRYDSLLEYLCAYGVSQPRNISALTADLSRSNNLTLGQLFAKFQPLNIVAKTP